LYLLMPVPYLVLAGIGWLLYRRVRQRPEQPPARLLAGEDDHEHEHRHEPLGDAHQPHRPQCRGQLRPAAGV